MRALVFVTAVFTRRVKFDHNAVALSADMRDTCFVFLFVGLKDKPLLTFLDTLPVSNEVDIE